MCSWRLSLESGFRETLEFYTSLCNTSLCLYHAHMKAIFSLAPLSLASHLIPLFSAVVPQFPSQTETVCVLQYPSRHDSAQTKHAGGEAVFPGPAASLEGACSGWPVSEVSPRLNAVHRQNWVSTQCSSESDR